MGHHYGGDYHVVHLWTIMCLAMGILGENERSYLGPDLAGIRAVNGEREHQTRNQHHH
jgi:hypothetical protein